MNPFLSLIKVQFKNTFGLTALKHKYLRRKRLLWQPVLFLLLMGFALLPFEAGLIAFYNQMYALLKVTGQEASMLTLAVLGGQTLVLMFGIFYLMSAFYFSGDLKQLLSLPLRPQDIVGAKLAVVLVNECLILVPFIAPALIIYGIRSEAAWWYWPFLLIVFITLPVIPLAISSLLIIPLMRFTAVTKNRDLFRIVGSILGVLVFVFIQLNFSQSGRMPGGQQLEQWLSAGKHLSQAAASAFPHVNWAVGALSLTSPAWALVNLLLFVAVSLVVLLPVLLLAGKWFFRGVTGGGEVRGSGRKARVLPGTVFKSRTPFAAILWREIRLFWRTPVFVLNGLLNYIFIPVFFFMSLQDKPLADLPTDNPQIKLIISLVAVGLIILNNSFSAVASTAVSREGKMFWISKHLPVPAREQVTAKLLYAMFFSLLGAFLIELILYLSLKLPAANLLLIAFLSIVGSFTTAELGLIIDLLRPNLDWTDPQRAMKGFNGLLALLIGMLMLGILGLFVGALVYFGLPPSLVYLLFAAVLVLVGLALYLFLIRLAEKRYRQIFIP